MKEKIKEIIISNELTTFQKTDKLLSLFEVGKKEYAINQLEDFLKKHPVEFSITETRVGFTDFERALLVYRFKKFLFPEIGEGG